MMSYLILSAPGFIPSPPTLVNKTATTITVSWTSVPSDADGYVVNATSDTHTVTQQVKGGSQNNIILKGCQCDPCNTCTCQGWSQVHWYLYLSPSFISSQYMYLYSSIEVCTCKYLILVSPFKSF